MGRSLHGRGAARSAPGATAQPINREIHWPRMPSPPCWRPAAKIFSALSPSLSQEREALRSPLTQDRKAADDGGQAPEQLRRILMHKGPAREKLTQDRKTANYGGQHNGHCVRALVPARRQRGQRLLVEVEVGVGGGGGHLHVYSWGVGAGGGQPLACGRGSEARGRVRG